MSAAHVAERPLDVAVVTSLYPMANRPNEGRFAAERWERMLARGHRVRVVRPVPYAPPGLFRDERADYARVPRVETRNGIVVRSPRYLHVPGGRKLALRNARAFARAGLREVLRSADGVKQPDVVIADYAWPAAELAPALHARGLPFVIHGRGSDVLEVAGEAGLSAELAANLKLAGNWCAVSKDLVQRMDEFGGRSGHGMLIPNGVDSQLFSIGSRDAARRELNLAGDSALVLVVGHLIARKDPLLALRAFITGAPANARIMFVGRGELEGELRAAGRELGGRFSLLGEVTPEHLARLYRAADLLLLTSSREGRPNVVLEALASGLPVVATAAGGTAELLEGLPGALVESRDGQAIGAAIGQQLSSPPSPETCRAQVRDLTWERASERLEFCLRRAMADDALNPSRP